MTTLRHTPLDTHKRWFLHAWGGMPMLDVEGIRQTDGTVLFTFSGPDDLRLVQFKFRSEDPSGQATWESDDFIRYIRLAQPPGDLWTFENSARILYTDPFPPGVPFQAGDIVTFQLITQRRFRGGKLYAWNPGQPEQNFVFGETNRDDAASLSSFSFPLQGWMVQGFHFKFIGRDDAGKELWESDTANRFWRPSDGSQTWTKSGQVSLRKSPLALTSTVIEMLFPATMSSAPVLHLIDPVEGSDVTIAVRNAPVPYDAGGYFQLATYEAFIFPEAAYRLVVGDGAETISFNRSFPADPGNLPRGSKFVLGSPDWIKGAFPSVAASVTLEIEPVGQGLQNGVAVNVGVLGAPPHATVAASQTAGGLWTVTLPVLQTVTHSFHLVPASGQRELSPYPAPFDTGIDIRRFFTPPAAPVTIHTIEGMYGISVRSSGTIANPPVSRQSLMDAAFGANVTQTGIFDAHELPYGPTPFGGEVYFVFHSPHAVCADLVLVDETRQQRVIHPMSLTPDLLYWWCQVPAAQAPPGTRYRFAFNDDLEVLDPAAREVLDRGNFQVSPKDAPTDPSVSWSVVVDTPALARTARAANWQTPGWESLVIYEIHAKRFAAPPTAFPQATPFEVVEDELKNVTRSGQPGYLHQLPVTAIQFLPLHEFKSTNGWGYNPSFFFAIESSYGGPAGFARLIDTAHTNGKAVLLDVVYNHMLDSPLTQVAYDVYRNGDAYGDRINNAHPIVKEFFRQATAYLVGTFGLDGFRFDDTKTVLNNNGWDFLATMRRTIRAVASATGRAWPYCVMENDPTDWNATNPAWSIMDGEWAISEVYEIGKSAYVPWPGNVDNASSMKYDMDAPQTWMRPFHEATRFGESHDTVSGQDPANKRLAARPPYGLGYQMSKALGALTLLSNGVPLLFMGQEIGDTRYFSFDNGGLTIDPQGCALPTADGSDQAKVLAWFKAIMGLRNDSGKGLQGDANLQVVRTGRSTLALAGGAYGNRIFSVVTFGTPDTRQNSGWLGLPPGLEYKEILNSSWPVFSTGLESNATNGGYDARMTSGQMLNLPWIGVVVLEAW